MDILGSEEKGRKTVVSLEKEELRLRAELEARTKANLSESFPVSPP